MTTFDNRTQTIFTYLCNSFPNTCHNFAILKIAVDPNNNQLLDMYQQKVDAHNTSILNNVFPDSGFDLFVPNNVTFDREIESKFIDFQIKTEMVHCDVNSRTYKTCAFNIHPRSSISKTPLMLANHTGIIDSGYRGSIIGAFRWLRPSRDNSNNNYYSVEQNTRLIQICHPTLCPIYVVIVDENELSTTERGAGGFGSTGV
jgi:dUTP pyrophosphatase